MLEVILFVFLLYVLHNPVLALTMTVTIFIGMKLVINSFIGDDEEWENQFTDVKNKFTNFLNKIRGK